MKPLSPSCRTDYQKQVDNFPFIGKIAKPTEQATVNMNYTFHEPPLTASPVFADRQSIWSFGRWQISKRKIWTPSFGDDMEHIFQKFNRTFSPQKMMYRKHKRAVLIIKKMIN